MPWFCLGCSGHICSVAGPWHQSSVLLTVSSLLKSVSLSSVKCPLCHGVTTLSTSQWNSPAKHWFALTVVSGPTERSRSCMPITLVTSWDSWTHIKPGPHLIDSLVIHCDISKCNCPVLLQHLCCQNMDSGCNNWDAHVATSRLGAAEAISWWSCQVWHGVCEVRTFCGANSYSSTKFLICNSFTLYIISPFIYSTSCDCTNKVFPDVRLKWI